MARAWTGIVRAPLDIDPIAVRPRLQQESRAILEGGTGFGDAGRWSFFGLRAIRRVVSDEADEDPLQRLGDHLKALDDEPIEDRGPDDPPFQGGWIGYLGYDLSRTLERLPNRSQPDSMLPDFAFEHYDTIAALDETTGRAEIIARDVLRQGERSVWDRVDAIRKKLATSSRVINPSRLDSPIQASVSRADYLARVAKALEYIRAGDIFQVNLAQKFEARGAFDPLDLYRALRRKSPSPFSAFLRIDDESHVISSSPEWFYQTRGNHIITRPIKGTRPRGKTEEDDARLAAELLASPKDRAELTMIVDLERNDLGRVCEYGSVRVTEAMAIESYAQVHHLVATIEGRLRNDVGPIDVVKAMFPGGSITGAPKIRAMEIIDELEPTRRGLYTGAIGYFGYGGASAFNIAIRTMVVEGDRVSYHVGGGIVADSDPESEYQETLHKGRAMREVLEGLGG